ncbi:hypothetical protein [Streptomyces sp. NPDC051577]|uniref:hypothetical protein n=1 Tax=Streptomyces sp. NPDC051577 TaxID=3155166 RepID=UPI003417618C
MADSAAVPTPDKNDESFWTTVMTLVDPAWSEPTDDDLFTMDDKVLTAVRSLAERISTRAQAYRTADKPFDWWYTATAADRQDEESEAVHQSYAEAIAGATEFLLAHDQAARRPGA